MTRQFDVGLEQGFIELALAAIEGEAVIEHARFEGVVDRVEGFHERPKSVEVGIGHSQVEFPIRVGTGFETFEIDIHEGGLVSQVGFEFEQFVELAFEHLAVDLQ